MCKTVFSMGAMFVWALSAGAQESTVVAEWRGSTGGSLSSAANWTDGVLPSVGGPVRFWVDGGEQKLTQDIETFAPSSVVVTNASGNLNALMFLGDSPLVVNGNVLFDGRAMLSRLELSSGLAGTGTLELRLATNNINSCCNLLAAKSTFAGRLVFDSGYLQCEGAITHIGDDDQVLVPDAITLRGKATLKNWNADLHIPAWQGIVLDGEGGGFCVGWSAENVSFKATVDGPITGDGRLYVSQCAFPVVLNNPDNAWTGGTEIGSIQSGGAYTGPAPEIIIGENGSFPEGDELIMAKNGAAFLELNGHSITVSNLFVGTAGVIRNSSDVPVVVHAQEAEIYGAFEGNVLLDCPGAKLYVDDDRVWSAPLVIAEGATNTVAVTQTGGAVYKLNGGTLALPVTAGFSERAYNSSRLGDIFKAIDGIYAKTRMGFNDAPAWGDPFGYFYMSEWYVPSTGLYRFVKRFNDSAALKVDDRMLISNMSGDAKVIVEDVPLTEGWHQVGVWFGHAAGPFGSPEYRCGLMWGPAGTSIADNGKTFDGADASFVFSPYVLRPVMVGAGGGTVCQTTEEALTSLPPIRLKGGVVQDVDAAEGDAVRFTGDVVIGCRGGQDVAVFDADVELAEDRTLTFDGDVWLKRLPPAGFRVTPGSVVFLSAATRSLESELRAAGAIIAFAPFNIDAYAEETIELPSGTTNILYTSVVNVGVQPRLTGWGETWVLPKNFVVPAGCILRYANASGLRQTGTIAGAGRVEVVNSYTANFTADNSGFDGVWRLGENGSDVWAHFLLASSAGSARATVVVSGSGTPDRGATLLDSEHPYPQRFVVERGNIIVGTTSARVASLQGPESASLPFAVMDGDLVVGADDLELPWGVTMGGTGRLVIDIGSSDYRLPALSGTGGIRIVGTGRVDVSALGERFAGALSFEPGVRLTSFRAAAQRPVFWLDASSHDSLVLSGEDVTRWNDVRDGADGEQYPHTYMTTRMAGWDRDKTCNAPTLFADASVLPGQVVDFGVQDSGKWFAFSQAVTCRTIFYVIGSRNGGGCCFFSDSKGSKGICRAGVNGNIDNVAIPASSPLYNPNDWSSVIFRDSYTLLNGVRVVPSTTGLSGNYDLVMSRLSEGVRLDGMAKDLRPLTGGHADGVKRSGGMSFAEVIIYDRALTDAEIANTQRYLQSKWFGTVTDATGGFNGALEIEGAQIDVPDAHLSQNVSSISGTGELVKTGAGTLGVRDVSDFDGTVSLEEGGVAFGMRLPSPAFWVDASIASSIVQENGRFCWRDRRWNDGSGADYVCATQRWSVAPTVLANALNGMDVVSFGALSTSHDRGLQWSRKISASALFLVIGSQESGGTLFGTDDTDCQFNRGNIAGASTPIYTTGYTYNEVVNGLTRIDGRRVDGLTTGLNGDYQVIAIRPTAPVSVGQFAHDRDLEATKTRDGGQRLAEVLVFTNALDDAQFTYVEGYLRRRWKGTAPSAALVDDTGAVPQTIQALGIDPQGTDAVLSLETRDGSPVVVNALAGEGAFVKTGDSTLTVANAASFTGSIHVAEGTLNIQGDVSSILDRAIFWVDAAKTTSITLDGETQEVVRWDDCRGNGRYAARHTKSTTTVNGTTYPNYGPTLMRDELNGLPVLDFGEWMGNRFLNWDAPISDIRTVFWVIGSQAGGGILLGYTGDTGVRDFYRAGYNGEQNFNEITKDNGIWARNVAAPVEAVCEAPTWLNGERVDGPTTGLSGGYDIVAVRTTGNARASAFGMDRDRAWRNSTGGQRLAEVIVFTSPLTDDEIAGIQAYLSRKWGVKVTQEPDAMARFIDVLLDEGAVLALSPVGTWVGSVGGAGAVNGAALLDGLVTGTSATPDASLEFSDSLVLSDGAHWTVTAGDDALVQVVVAGAASFNGAVSMEVSNADALRGRLPTILLRADSILGFDRSKWTVTSDTGTRLIVSLTEDGLVLDRNSSTVLIFR